MDRKKPGRPPRPAAVHQVRADLWTEQANALHAYAKAHGMTLVKLLQDYTEQLTGVPAWPDEQEQEEFDLSA